MIKFILILSAFVLAETSALAAPKYASRTANKKKLAAYQQERRELAEQDLILVEPSRPFSVVFETAIKGMGRSFGAGAGYTFMPDQMLEASFSDGDHLFRDLNTKTYGLRLRSFWGRTFNTSVGLAWQHFTYTDDETYTDILVADQPRNWSYEAEADRTVLDLAIGNRWKLAALTIGCDWVGLLIPLQSAKISEKASGVAENPRDAKDARSDMENFLDATDLQLVRFHIGISF